MAHIIADRVKEVSTTTGTGTFALGGAVLGGRTFSSALANSDTCYYGADDAFGNWEIGLGVYSSNTLARTLVLQSSNSNSLVDFPAGAKGVFLTNPASNTPLLATGSFTPTMVGSTAAGVGTYTTQTGSYTINGNLLFFSLGIAWSAHTGTGTMSIAGLPFRAAQQTTCPLVWNTLTYTGVPTGLILANSNQLDIVFAASTGTLAGVTVDTTASFVVSGVYSIA